MLRLASVFVKDGICVPVLQTLLFRGVPDSALRGNQVTKKDRVLVCAMTTILAACGPAPFDEKLVEPVRFEHADEIVGNADFIAVADRRVFAVMAFANAMGFDDEAEGEAMHPVRALVRERVAANLAACPEKTAEWKRWYDRVGLYPFHYQDYALGLSSDHPFRRIRPNAEYGYPHALARLAGFPALLNDFWEKAGLETVWNEVKPAYLEEIASYDAGRVSADLRAVWAYLRAPRPDTYVIANVPNLLDEHYSAIGAEFEKYRYSVESPGSHSNGLNAHEYLHSYVNGLVVAAYRPFKPKLAAYFDARKNGPLRRSYGSVDVFAYECLVRALDNRMFQRSAGDAERETKGGLTLVKPFYELLEGYETSGQSFEAYLPALFEKLPAFR